MMNIPAHKQTDPDKKPGQIKNDVVLSDYIERVLKEETPVKKLTFEKWWNTIDWQCPDWRCCAIEKREAFLIWKAAQENV